MPLSTRQHTCLPTRHLAGAECPKIYPGPQRVPYPCKLSLGLGMVSHAGPFAAIWYLLLPYAVTFSWAQRVHSVSEPGHEPTPLSMFVSGSAHNSLPVTKAGNGFEAGNGVERPKPLTVTKLQEFTLAMQSVRGHSGLWKTSISTGAGT
jgi:hypothetical protein